MTDEAARAANQANWDERVPGHVLAYGVEDFISDPHRISDVVRDDLALMAPHLRNGAPVGSSLVHLQCHVGLDTLSWARLGATVTGIDFSPAATTAARGIAAHAGLAATFLDSDIEHALDACPQRFDIVYTGIGAVPWLPDLSRWGQVVAGLLKPGGLFYIRDSHPILNALDYNRNDGVLALTEPYFPTGAPVRYDHGTTYANDSVQLAAATTYEWQHSLSEIVQALLDAGLILTSLAEHRFIPWPALPILVLTPEGYALPDARDRVPLAFSLTATSRTT